MYIDNEIPWNQFCQLSNIRILPLTEQQQKYNQYINNLERDRQYSQNIVAGNIIYYLLHEDGSYLLQENGSKIYL